MTSLVCVSIEHELKADEDTMEDNTLKLTEEQKDAVLEEVGYTRNQLDSDLEQIKEWLKLQHHLPACRLKENDSFLKTYLTGCKGSLEKTKRKLDAYYTYRSHSALFDSRDPLDSGYVKMRELVYFTPFRIMTKGRTSLFVYCRVTDADQEEFDFQYYLRLFLNVSELWLREVGYSAQVYLLGDFERTTIQHHIMRVKPLLLKDFIYYLLEVLPIRFCKVVFINAPPFIASFMNHAVVPFLTKKIKERLLITENGIEAVIEDFDKATLPSDYGGHFNVGEEDKNWSDEELNRRQWYLNELSERCDESKRIVLEDPTNPYFGVPGSLKKLVVD